MKQKPTDWIMNRSWMEFSDFPLKTHTHIIMCYAVQKLSYSFITINYSIIYYWSLLHVCLHICNVFVNRELRKIGGFSKIYGEFWRQTWGFPKPWGYPKKWMVYFIKMDDLGVPPWVRKPLDMETRQLFIYTECLIHLRWSAGHEVELLMHHNGETLTVGKRVADR